MAVRITVVLVFGLVLLAGKLGFDVLIGGFVAGMIVRGAPAMLALVFLFVGLALRRRSEAEAGEQPPRSPAARHRRSPERLSSATALHRPPGPLDPRKILLPGRVAQWESARFTRERSLVRNQPCP